MTRCGRKPMALDHIPALHGSERAKHRMTAFLQTLQSGCTVSQACDQTGLKPAQFHALRHRWLQGSLQLLEPRTPGRPSTVRTAEQERIEQLEQEKHELQRELALAHAQCEALAALGSPGTVPNKRGRFQVLA